MAVVLKDRVKETTSTTGTSNFVLGGSSSGYQPFSVIGANNYTYYCCYDSATGDWEVGYGQYTTTAGGTLVRNTVLSNSAATTSKIVFAAGPKDLFITYPAEKAIYEELAGNVLIDGGPITVIGNGVTGYTTFSAALGEMYADINSFAQFYAQNLNDGSEASADFVAYNDLGDGNTNFVDVGINSSNYSSATYPIFTPASAYLFNDGGEMFVGSATDDLVLFAGGVDVADEAVRIDKTTKVVTTQAGLTLGGALTGVGGSFTAPVTTTSSMSSPGSTELVTRAYVDTTASTAFVVHPAVRLVANTYTGTNSTYNNGASGVGATLTATVNGALSIDGVTPSVADRILLRAMSTAAYNGVYTVTAVGSAGTPWQLTRATDFDTAGAGEIANNAYFYVTGGATYAGYSYVLAQTAAITVGTTALPFDLFSSAQVYTGGTNIDVTGTVISLTGTVAATNGGTGTNTVAAGDLLYGSGTNTWGKLAAGAAYKSLVMNAGGTNVEWNAVALNQSGAVSGALGPTNGGTGQSAYSLGDIIYSDATNSLARLAGNTTTTKKFLGQTGTGSGSAAPSWQQPDAADITGLAPSATTDTTNASNITSGTLGTARLSGSYTGITGVGTLAAGTWNASTIGATYGGTGNTSYAVGDLLYADTTTTLARLADVAVGNALISGGVSANPSWGKIGLTTHVSGTLPIANGGTNGTATPTAGGVPYGTGTAYGFTAAGTAGQVLTSNGTSAPTWASAAGFPSGTVMLFVQTAAPTGWTKSTTHNDKALRVVSGAASSGGTVAFTTAFASQGVNGTLSSTTATNQNTTATGTLSVTVSAGTLAVGVGTLGTNNTTQGGSVSLSGGGSVSGYTLTTTDIPSHNHSINKGFPYAGGGGNQPATDNGASFGSMLSASTGGSGSHSHGFTNPSYSFTGSAHNHSISGAPSLSGSPSVTGQTFTGTAHTHTQDAHTHTFTGTAINLAVQYVDVIIATKD